jgi:ABC-type cobalt transport system substrate-binding protein
MFQIQFPDVTPDRSVEFSIPSVAINQVVPLKISPIRFLLTAAMILLLFAFWPGSIFYGIRLNLRSIKQRTLILLVMIAFCGWFAWTTFSSYTGSDTSFTEQKSKLSQSYKQYTQLVDALLVPRYALLEKPEKDILNAERPYDKTYRDHYNIFYAWDTALYHGAYYVYFGVVPAVTVLLPWKRITGSDLELDYASLLFCCLGFGWIPWFICLYHPKSFSADSIFLAFI